MQSNLCPDLFFRCPTPLMIMFQGLKILHQGYFLKALIFFTLKILDHRLLVHNLSLLPYCLPPSDHYTIWSLMSGTLYFFHQPTHSCKNRPALHDLGLRVKAVKMEKTHSKQCHFKKS